jgi:hypothetical protein
MACTSESDFDDNEYNIDCVNFFDAEDSLQSDKIYVQAEEQMFIANKCCIRGFCLFIDDALDTGSMTIIFPTSVKAHQVHRFLSDCYSFTDEKMEVGRYEFLSDIIKYAKFLYYIDAYDTLWTNYDKCLFKAMKDEEWSTTKCIPASWTVILLDPYRKHLPRSMRFIESFTAVTMLQNPTFRGEMFRDNKHTTMKLSSETLIKIMEIYVAGEDQARQESEHNDLERASFDFVSKKYKDVAETLWNSVRDNNNKRHKRCFT